MHWKPEISESDNFPSVLDAGLLYSLSRLTNFRLENPSLNVFEEVRICHSDSLCKPYGQAFKGEECWDEKKIRDYHDENGTNRSALIPAYRGSDFERSGRHDLLANWTGCDFYIESVSDVGPKPPIAQAKMEQMERATLLSLLILTQGQISSVRPIKYTKFPRVGGYGYHLGSYHISNTRLNDGDTFVLSVENEGVLVDLASQIYERKHPEAYLASLRLMRAINRSQPDDGIVDLVICLEALFNNTKDPGIALRVAQRLSRLLDQRKNQRRKTSRFVKEAYGMRSNLVHGTRRQIEFLENLLGNSEKKKGKPLEFNALRKMSVGLVRLVCSALLARYTTYRDYTQDMLLDHLDDKAI